MIAVVNSSPIILLAKIGRLDLLRHLFDDVIIPRAVHDEITVVGDRPGESFRYNNRETNDARRFQRVAGGIAGKRLTYAELTGAYTTPA